jgi:hypothetical protein
MKTKTVNGVVFRTTEAGNICCNSFDADGRFVRPPERNQCDKCREHFAAQQDHGAAPPDIYAAGVKAMRAAEAPPDAFAKTWAEQGASAIVATRAALDAESAPRFKTLSAEDLSPYSPPNGYAIALGKEAR